MTVSAALAPLPLSSAAFEAVGFVHKVISLSSANQRRTDSDISSRSDFKTESQNHRIVGVGRDLCGSSSPTPC